jgi:hypothetical protein
MYVDFPPRTGIALRRWIVGQRPCALQKSTPGIIKNPDDGAQMARDVRSPPSSLHGPPVEFIARLAC